MPDMRAVRYTPAVTIVAAWISADTGVGPAMASGSHTCSGICADLPVAPTNSSSPTRLAGTIIAAPLPVRKAPLIVSMSSVPKARYSRNMPNKKPASPMRLVMNAFRPAFAFVRSSNQKPMRRYEARPTPSHPTNSTSMERPSTSSSMKNRKRFRYAKKRPKLLSWCM